MPRQLLFVTLCLLLSLPAAAKVYQCEMANGRMEYRDTPCKKGDQKVYQKGKTKAASRTKLTRTQNYQLLSGPWCNFATSLSMTGSKDLSNPAQWLFTEDSLSVDMGGRHIESGFSQEKGLLHMDNPRFGNYDVLMQGSDSMVMKGDYGYYFFRKGYCQG
ncbi:DUF4124 domain-containing protein [Gallaecimonas sp. GXIMD4217]|uniref:DUF4124 domain-containing protein n=1 Tax=Gallaecimonas sp. GXIMD4217 TaxID=3131927 RepID=UPI00311AD98E